VYAITIAALQLAFVHPQLLGLSFDLEGVSGQFMFWIFFFPLLTFTSYLAFFRRRLPVVQHIIGMAYIASSFFILITVLNTFLLKFGIYLKVIPFGLFLICVFIWNARIYASRTLLSIFLYAIAQVFCFVFICALLLFSMHLIAPGSVDFG
jgi:hypothetical protein